jgi:hypothetical protein
MSNRNQALCAWSGMIFLAMFMVGFAVLARFLPPPSPDMPVEKVVALYTDHAWSIRGGIALMLVGVGFMLPFVAVISMQMRRMERGTGVLSYTQLLSGAALAPLFSIVATLWATATFRTERSPDLILLLHDLAWITLLTPVGAVFVQNLSIGIAVLRDRRSSPVFPRWAAYFNFWVGLMALPGAVGFWFLNGPFAWNGLFVFWIPLVLFALWYFVTFVLVLRAIYRDDTAANDKR